MVSRNIDSVKIMLNYGLELGLAREAILHKTGIRAEHLMRSEQPVAAEQELCLINNVLKHCDLTPKTLGIELGKRYSFTSYGVFGYAIMSSTTLRNAISFGIRFLDLTYVFSSLALIQHHITFSVTFIPQTSYQYPQDLRYQNLTNFLFITVNPPKKSLINLIPIKSTG